MPTADPTPSSHELSPELRAELRDRIRALPPLTPDQLDALADVVAQVHLDARTGAHR